MDFVVYGPHGFYAVEVKNTRRIRPADMRGLQAFRQDYPEAGAVLLYRGERRFVRGDVLCLPVERFLADLRPHREPA